MKRSVICLLLFLELAACSSPPTEDAVRTSFEAKKKVYEQILEMSDEDYARTKITRIAPAFTRLEHNWGWPRPESELGISKERWDAYRTLFAEAGLPSGINREGTTVFFSKWGEGLADNSHDIGVIFSPTPPFSDTQLSDSQRESQRFSFKSLSGNWYYYDWVTW